VFLHSQIGGWSASAAFSIDRLHLGHFILSPPSGPKAILFEFSQTGAGFGKDNRRIKALAVKAHRRPSKMPFR
jgi:hypothetical protein